jgi:hypothetical protein
MLFQQPAKHRASVISGELCGLRNSAQVVIDPPVKLGVVRRIFFNGTEMSAPEVEISERCFHHSEGNSSCL